MGGVGRGWRGWVGCGSNMIIGQEGMAVCGGGVGAEGR